MKKVLLSVGTFLLPVVAFAQTGTNNISQTQGQVTSALNSLTAIVNSVIPFLLAIAVVVFIWGVIKYVVASSPDDKAAGRGYIIYGIIGIVVILSIFGLVKLVQNIFGIGNTQLTGNDFPSIPTTNY